MEKQSTRYKEIKKARDWATAESILWLLLFILQVIVGEGVAAFLTLIIIFKVAQNYQTEKAYQLMTGLLEKLLDELEEQAKGSFKRLKIKRKAN